MQSESLPLWTDNELLEALKEGDRLAFDKIYNKYWSKLYLSAYNLLRNRQASEDIIQEVFVQLWLKRSSQSIGNLNSYMYAAVRFQVFKAIRDGKVRHDLSEEAEKISINGDIENILIEQDINKRLDESIGLLPEKCREIFTLSRKEYLSVKEIAERLRITPKTVENQITIALRRIRSNMSDLLFWVIFILAEIWKK